MSFKHVFDWLVKGTAISLLVLGAAVAHGQSDATATITIQAGQPGVHISSNLFGIFFEEINSAGEGGIYAELVRNRSFEEASKTNYWQFISSGTASGTMTADSSLPFSARNLYSLKLTQSAGSGSIGAVNSGFWGMNVRAGEWYDLSFYARTATRSVERKTKLMQ